MQGWVPYQGVFSHRFLFSGVHGVGGSPEAKQPHEVHAQMGKGAISGSGQSLGPRAPAGNPIWGLEGCVLKCSMGGSGQAVPSTNCCLGHKFPRP